MVRLLRQMMAAVASIAIMVMAVNAVPVKTQLPEKGAYAKNPKWPIGVAKSYSANTANGTKTWDVTKSSAHSYTIQYTSVLLHARQAPATVVDTTFDGPGDDEELLAIYNQLDAIEANIGDIDRTAFLNPGISAYRQIGDVRLSATWLPEVQTTEAYVSADTATSIAEDSFRPMLDESDTSMRITFRNAGVVLGALIIICSA